MIFSQKSKKGQITVFIILGIFMLISASILLYLNQEQSIANSDQDSNQDTINLQYQKTIVNSLIQDCLDDASGQALISFGLLGGTDQTSGAMFESEYFNASYLYYLDELYIDDIDSMQTKIEELTISELEKCLPKGEVSEETIIDTKLTSIDNLYSSLVSTEPTATVETIDEGDSMLLTLNWPVEVEVDGKRSELATQWEIEYPVDLNKIETMLTTFLAKLQQNKYALDTFFFFEYNVNADIAFVDNDTYIFLITDNNTMIDSTPLQILFAAKIR